MKKFVILIYLAGFSFCIYCQSNNEVDSVFKSFFKYLEINDSLLIERGNDDSLCIYFEKLQIVYAFFENISGIYMERELKNNVIYINYEDSVKNKWEEWYNINQTKLVWVEDGKSINNEEGEWFKCLDYEKFYPSQIRFSDNINEIPKSTPPPYIKELEDNKHYLQPLYEPPLPRTCCPWLSTVTK